MHGRKETWLWFIRDAVTDKLRISRHRMTAEDAEAFHPGATRVPGTMEYREVQLTADAELGRALEAWSRSAATGRPE
jgi:hypothetical protein